MSPRVAASLSGLVGGGCWLVSFGLQRAGRAADETSVVALDWTGYGFVLLAALLAGVAVVPTAPLWLRAVVALGAMLLVLALIEVVRGEVGPSVTEGIGGVLATGLALLTLLRAQASRRRVEECRRP